MAEPHFGNDDDLPRTLRRERDSREREAREREREAALAAAAAHAQDPRLAHGAPATDYARQGYQPADTLAAYEGPAFSGTVNRFEVPFLHLMKFFIKAVFAAIPALILLTLLLIAGGQLLKRFFPTFLQFEIVVKSGPPAVVEPAAPPAPASPKAPASSKAPAKR